jgi:secreted trypsin-like serine protease
MAGADEASLSMLGGTRASGYGWTSMKTFAPLAAIALSLVSPAHAIVGGAATSNEGIGRAVVTIVGSRGNFCSGSLIAPALVLTAAHCVEPGADYKIVEYDADRKPQLRDVKHVAVHPGFQMRAIFAHRATADVALLQLEIPARGKTAASVGAPLLPISPGAKFAIAGIGVTVRGDGKSGGIIRTASLVATGRPGTLQIRLVDPATGGTREGLGACTGDSGGPATENQQAGPTIIGVISWSTGPNGSAGCGGLTGITPLTLYRDWILRTARQWGFAL